MKWRYCHMVFQALGVFNPATWSATTKCAPFPWRHGSLGSPERLPGHPPHLLSVDCGRRSPAVLSVDSCRGEGVSYDRLGFRSVDSCRGEGGLRLRAILGGWFRPGATVTWCGLLSRGRWYQTGAEFATEVAPSRGTRGEFSPNPRADSCSVNGGLLSRGPMARSTHNQRLIEVIPRILASASLIKAMQIALLVAAATRVLSDKRGETWQGLTYGDSASANHDRR
jgi:hypothetical protein